MSRNAYNGMSGMLQDVTRDRHAQSRNGCHGNHRKCHFLSKKEVLVLLEQTTFLGKTAHFDVSSAPNVSIFLSVKVAARMSMFAKCGNNYPCGLRTQAKWYAKNLTFLHDLDGKWGQMGVTPGTAQNSYFLSVIFFENLQRNSGRNNKHACQFLCRLVRSFLSQS